MYYNYTEKKLSQNFVMIKELNTYTIYIIKWKSDN